MLIGQALYSQCRKRGGFWQFLSFTWQPSWGLIGLVESIRIEEELR